MTPLVRELDLDGTAPLLLRVSCRDVLGDHDAALAVGRPVHLGPHVRVEVGVRLEVADVATENLARSDGARGVEQRMDDSLAHEVHQRGVAVAGRHRADEGRERAEAHVGGHDADEHSVDVAVESRRDHEARTHGVVVRLRPLDDLRSAAVCVREVVEDAVQRIVHGERAARWRGLQDERAKRVLEEREEGGRGDRGATHTAKSAQQNRCISSGTAR